MARYWRISGIQTTSNTLDVQALALSDGSTDYAAPLLSGALGASFVIDWDLGADLPVDRLKLTAAAQADWPTSLLLLQSADGQSWGGGLTFNTMAWPGSGVQQSFVFDTVLQTVLLLNMNGTNGSTTFTDSGLARRSITAASASISTAQGKFGGSSLAPTGGTGYLVAAQSLDFAFGATPFTVECWVYANAYNSNGGRILAAGGGVVAWNSTNGIHWLLQVNGTGVTFNWWNGTASAGLSGSMSLSAWYHLAATFDGATMRLFLNGVMLQSQATTMGQPTTTPYCNVGTIAGEGSATYAFNGYIDDVRITKGVARYTANFTPPTAEFFAITGLTPPAIATPLDTPAIVLRDPGHQDGTLHLRAPDPSAIDMIDGGSHKVVGTVAEKASPTNLPLVRRVMLIDEQSHRVVRETWSDAAGNYTFTSVRSATTYTVLAYDHTETYRAVIADRITPEPMP